MALNLANEEGRRVAASGCWAGYAGAADLLTAPGCGVTCWDMAETASGGPFPQVLQHGIFLNCILARPGCPVFVPASAKTAARKLTVIGDIACDLTKDIRLYALEALTAALQPGDVAISMLAVQHHVPIAKACLAKMAAEVVRGNSYAPDEPDRVVPFVSLKAERDGRIMFHETWAMDAWGDARGSAMARLVSTPVSTPVSCAVESLLTREIAAGVHPAPHDPKLISKWLGQVKGLAQYMKRIDHLA